ncbi:MAG: hypothetical protein E6J42_11800, partial [Chloroflexi bacterium]
MIRSALCLFVAAVAATVLWVAVGHSGPLAQVVVGAMQTMAIDTNPLATPANDATTVGTIEHCLQINENNIQDADETAV